MPKVKERKKKTEEWLFGVHRAPMLTLSGRKREATGFCESTSIERLKWIMAVVVEASRGEIKGTTVANGSIKVIDGMTM